MFDQHVSQHSDPQFSYVSALCKGRGDLSKKKSVISELSTTTTTSMGRGAC